MKKIAFALAACTLGGCGVSTENGDPGESISNVQEALDVTQTSALTKRQTPAFAANSNEASRQADTDDYYGKHGPDTGRGVRIDARGIGSQFIWDSLNTLSKFRARYGFAGNETVTTYYNRGDLGIGREMHCVDNIADVVKGEIACYVRNFAAGDDDKEFSFGLSSNIAFTNIDNNHPFATVAMVFRDLAPDLNKVFFVVYDNSGNLQSFAALDRAGFLAAKGLDTSGRAGATYNNHIPSNCITCHGGSVYDNAIHSQSGALFLPFDVDQFDFRSDADKASQAAAFKRQNEMVWKVAAGSTIGTATNSVKEQLNKWYNNTPGLQDRWHETFENNFNTTAVVDGWTGAYAGFFNSVVRPACRNCHMTNSDSELDFNTEGDFRNRATGLFSGNSVPDLCSFTMPHALQTVRQFWQSDKPAQFENYLRGLTPPRTAEADQLHGCGPGNVATLDPPLIDSAALL